MVAPPRLPESINFAGEDVPLSDPDVRARLERELIVNTFKHASTLFILKNSGRWQSYIQNLLKDSGVPEDFFYLAVIESELDPNSRSSAGATGFWHFVDATASEYDLEISAYVDDRRDPFLSTQAAIKYFKRAYDRLQSWTLVAAAFNRGSKGIEEALKYQGVKNYYELYLNEETYRYVFRILALKLIIESPADFGFMLNENSLYRPYKADSIIIEKSIQNLPEFAKSIGLSYRTMKDYNPWMLNNDYKLLLKSGKKYVIRIPPKN